MSSDAPDKLSVPALLVIPVVLKLIIQIQAYFSLHNNLHLFVVLHVNVDSSGKKPGEECASYQCVANAICSATSNTCACNTGYEATLTATPTSCESEYTYMKELDDINVSN